MITARKSRWFESIFALYNQNLIARRFRGLRVCGLENLRARKRDAPLVLYANHSSWWDGLIIYHLGRTSRLEQYAMMEEKQLKEYPFHRKLGAFSVVRENPRKAMESILYAASLLRNTDRVLWIFPQGKIEPNDVRPLNLYSGVARIIERARGAYAAPVAMRYEFLDDFRPDALVRIEAPVRINVESAFDPKELTKTFSCVLTRTLESLRADILDERLDGYVEIVAPRRRRKR